jgi:Holliday junction DNA helicase RuvB
MLLDLFRNEVEFKNIQGYDDIKDIVRRTLDAEDNCNLLFIGPPASSKTLFLLGILESKKGVYFDGSNTTNRILDVLEEKRPKNICIDELDKMPRQFQEKLLNFMESGHIKVDQMRKQYDFTIKGAKIFGPLEDITRTTSSPSDKYHSILIQPSSHVR